jgi:ankyrin repeat protein
MQKKIRYTANTHTKKEKKIERQKMSKKKVFRPHQKILQTQENKVRQELNRLAKELIKASSKQEVVDFLEQRPKFGQNTAEKIINYTHYGSDSPFLDAVRNGKPEIAEVLLKWGADPFQKDYTGESALQIAPNNVRTDIRKLVFSYGLLYYTKENDVVQVKQLMKQEQYTDLNVQDRNGKTALLYASEKKNVEMVDALLSPRTNVNVQNERGETPIMLAANSDNVKMATLLLDKGSPDVDIQDTRGDTPLIYAALSNNVEMAQLLLKAGAQVDIEANDGSTAMDQATSQEMKDLLEEHSGVGPKPGLKKKRDPQDNDGEGDGGSSSKNPPRREDRTVQGRAARGKIYVLV